MKYVLGVVALLAVMGCQPDYPATADVTISNDTSATVTIFHCTTSCGTDDLQEHVVIAPSSSVTVGVNGDPSFQETWVVRAVGGVSCLYVNASESTWEVSSARPLTVTACPKHDLR